MSPDRLAGLNPLNPRSPSQAECTNHDATRLRLTDSSAARVRTVIRPHHLPANEILRLQIEAGRRPSPVGAVAKSFFPESAYVSSHGPGKQGSGRDAAGGRDPYYFPQYTATHKGSVSPQESFVTDPFRSGRMGTTGFLEFTNSSTEGPPGGRVGSGSTPGRGAGSPSTSGGSILRGGGSVRSASPESPKMRLFGDGAGARPRDIDYAPVASQSAVSFAPVMVFAAHNEPTNLYMEASTAGSSGNTRGRPVMTGQSVVMYPENLSTSFLPVPHPGVFDTSYMGKSGLYSTSGGRF